MTIFCTRSTLAATLLLSTAAPAFAQLVEDEIIVTGSPLSRSVDEAITGMSVLSGDELADRLAGTIGETLKSEPGVSSTYFGAGASRPIIRGQGGDRVRVLTNGIGSIDASSASPDHAVAAEPAQAERIEVLRGAALLRYGSSGSGGVVNVIDGRIPTEKPEGVDGALRIGASSVDQGIETAGSVDVGSGDFVLHLDGTFKEAGDYRIPTEGESRAQLAEEGEDVPDDFDDSRILENSASKSHAVTAGLSYIGDRAKLGIAVHKFDANYGIPGGHGHEEEEGEEHDEDHDEEEHEEEGEESVSIGLDQTRVDINGSVELDGFLESAQIFAGIADYKHTEFEGDEIGTVFTNEGYEVRIEAIQRENNGWRAAHGVQIRQRDFAAIGDEAFVPPSKTNQIGVYTFHEVEIGKGHVEGALRYENTDQKNSTLGLSRSFDLFSVSAGGDVHLTDAVRFGGTVFRTERAPTTEELFSNGPHLATNQFELGDITLGKEVATGIEGAIRHREDNHFATLNLFYTNYSDYIFEVETGDEEDGLPVFQFTAEDAEFYGFEVQGGMNIGSMGSFDIKADALAEYVRAKTKSGNLPRIPPLSVLTGIEAESDRFRLRAELDYAAKQDKLSDGELATEDFGLVNMFADWKSPIGAQDVTLSLSVLNLLDSEARQHTSFLKDLVPLPGRNVRFSIRTAF